MMMMMTFIVSFQTFVCEFKSSGSIRTCVLKDFNFEGATLEAKEMGCWYQNTNRLTVYQIF